jgi:hypothetical protein
MQTSKNWFGLVMAALPVLFCGGLLLYLNNVRGAFGGLIDSQLGPTMFGIGAFGLLFLVLFLLKLRKLAGGASASSPAARAAAAVDAARSDFDADAAFERYMSRRGDTPPLVRPPPGSFGRKPD